MRVLINYADEQYRSTQKLNSWTAYHVAKFDRVYSYGPEDIDEEFYEKNKEILLEKRGNGLWLWKPYFVKKVMEQCEDGDVIFYCDSGAFFVRNVKPVLEILKQENFFVCDYPLLEVCFTKPECFEKMQCDTEEFYLSNQMIATYFAFKCCEETRAFVDEWLHLCENRELIWPALNLNISLENKCDFIAHREDQSIFSLLCKKHKIIPHKDCSQRGKDVISYYNPLYAYDVPKHSDRYKPLIFVHKMKKVKVIKIIKYYFLLLKLKSLYRKNR